MNHVSYIARSLLEHIQLQWYGVWPVTAVEQLGKISILPSLKHYWRRKPANLTPRLLALLSRAQYGRLAAKRDTTKTDSTGRYLFSDQLTNTGRSICCKCFVQQPPPGLRRSHGLSVSAKCTCSGSPRSQCCPLNCRLATQAAGLSFVISTADRAETRTRNLPSEILWREAGRKQPLKHISYQHCRSFPHWWKLYLGNSPLRSGTRNEQWEVDLSPSVVLNAKNCLGGHSLTQREWGEELEVTILLFFGD